MLLTEIFYDDIDNDNKKGKEILETTESLSVMDTPNRTRSGTKKEVFIPINTHNPIFQLT